MPECGRTPRHNYSFQLQTTAPRDIANRYRSRHFRRLYIMAVITIQEILFELLFLVVSVI
uniref:Uncharacterized protein n=1 Tax=Anguilla anguilla TaxID=7936 RepID=A0A0E9SDY8_ANGAN